MQQALLIFSAIFCGNIAGIWLHCWTWRLRHTEFKMFGTFGYVSLALIEFCFLYWFSRVNDSRLGPVFQAQQYHWIFYAASGIFSGVAILSFLHSRQIQSRLWDAVLALLSEILLASLMGCFFLFIYWNLMKQQQWIVWFFQAYGLSLLCLAIFRPFLLKIYAQFLQMKPDWFRLNYQWKKSKF